MSPLPQFVRDRIASCPSAGTGVHHWLFGTARILHHFYPDKEQLFLLLREATHDCGRYIPDDEIWQAIQNSAACAWKGRLKPSYAHVGSRNGLDVISRKSKK